MVSTRAKSRQRARNRIPSATASVRRRIANFNPRNPQHNRNTGFENTIRRVKIDEDVSETYDVERHKGQKTHVDSIVHRFQREKGFSLGDEEEIMTSEHLASARICLNSMSHFQKSQDNRIKCQAYFENYVLKVHENNPYATFLTQIRDIENVNNPVFYLKPSDILVNSWIMHMSDPVSKITHGLKGRENKYHTIMTRVGAVQGTCQQLGQSKILDSAESKKLLKRLSGK